MPSVSSAEAFTLPTGCIASKKRQSTPQSVQLVPHNSPGGPSLMVPIPFAVAAPPPGVHIMPSLQPELPIGRSQHLKCHQSAAQRFPLYLLGALPAKKGNQPPKASNLSLTILRGPVPDGPNSFCSGCAAPWGTHNALTSTRTPYWKISTLEMPSVSSAEAFTLSIGCIASKKRQSCPQSVQLVPHNSPRARP